MIIPFDEAVIFFGPESPFSNWYKGPFVYNGLGYLTNEHFMMAKKAALFGDWVIHDKILRAKTAFSAKKLGREVMGFDEKIWSNWRMNIVGKGKLEQAKQNPIVLQAYVENAGKTFIEASPYDLIWGIGLGELHPGCYDTDQWLGENLLGIVNSKVAVQLKEMTS
ncbi:MAG: NADAR family protein [Gammaproteobacteria bacterium]|nr:NADAR family protein [Acholeplasmataceae bacterium]MCK9528940.1 NADAR family protein [Gammaproteobacteria bacterium]